MEGLSQGTSGRDLLEEFIRMTGVDPAVMQAELEDLLTELNIDPETMTTDDLRRLTQLYLHKITLDLEGNDKALA